MHATSGPALSSTQDATPTMAASLLEARRQLHAIVQRLMRPATPTVEKANLYGKQDALYKVIGWIAGIESLELPDAQKHLHFRTLASFIKANLSREREDTARQERVRLNSLEWRNLSTGRQQGYEYCLNMLRGLGIEPLR